MTPSEIFKRYEVTLEASGPARDACSWLRALGSRSEESVRRAEQALLATRPTPVTDARPGAWAEVIPTEQVQRPQFVEVEEVEVEAAPQPEWSGPLPDLSWTRAALYERAKEYDVPRRSKMTKPMLVKALLRLAA